MTKKPTFQPSIKQLDATNKVYLLRREMNDIKLASLLEISKVTLYTRVRISNWDAKEIILIEYNLNPKLKKLIDSLDII